MCINCNKYTTLEIKTHNWGEEAVGEQEAYEKSISLLILFEF